MPAKGTRSGRGVTIAKYTAARQEPKKPPKEESGAQDSSNTNTRTKKTSTDVEEEIVFLGLCMNENCLEELAEAGNNTLQSRRTKIYSNKFHAAHEEEGTTGYTCCGKCDKIVTTTKVTAYPEEYSEANFFRRLKEGKLRRAEGTIPGITANNRASE